jgi:mannonate dehydratase
MSIRIGARIHPDWLQSENDHDLRFLKQIGVDDVDITLDMVKGYRETGCFARADLQELVERLDAAGLKIERANSLFPQYKDAHTGGPESARQIDNLCKIAEMLGEVGAPVFGIQCFLSASFVKGRSGWSSQQGRGGYGFYAFDQNEVESATYQPTLRITADELWANIVNIYKQVVPVAERAGVKVAMHGNDPPIPNFCGNPQILCRFADFDRLFAEVPSPNNGMTFCVGTRYESGEDIFEGIQHFGEQGKIFHVHFRNVRGTLPQNRGYAEVFMDDGDIDMRKVVRALHAVGYDGVIDFDHAMRISGDTPHARQYIAFAVGYMKGLLASLE